MNAKIAALLDLSRKSKLVSSAKLIGRLLLLSLLSVAVAIVGFLIHVNLSSAGFAELLLVLLVAVRYGFFTATMVSICAFLGLNFLFTEPVFTFVVYDPQNWVALFTFEATALLVSGLSNKVMVQMTLTEEQRARAMRLYDLSRAVLLIDQRPSATLQLSRLIKEIFGVRDVQIWIDQDESALLTQGQLALRHEDAIHGYSTSQDSDDPVAGCSARVLRLGTTPIGGLSLQGWTIDALSADAIASIVAISLERTRSIQRETRAEVERDAERLRSAILDALAHSFKTPLTAIGMASSGLLAIDLLSDTQLELVSLIDERVSMLSQLTTRLLQTAALEAKEIRLRCATISMGELISSLISQQEHEIRARVTLESTSTLRSDYADGQLICFAVQQMLDNAAKYSVVDSPILIKVEQGSEVTLVAVQNSPLVGTAIRDYERTKIFERFYRGIDAVHSSPGTGLGLSIVKKVAEAHGGQAWVESQLESTCFKFSIQRNQQEKNG